MKRVTHACFHCKKAHAACDTSRPCSRCVSQGKAAECRDPEPKKRGRKPKPKIGKIYDRQKAQKLSPPPMGATGGMGVHLNKWAAETKLAGGPDLRQWSQTRSMPPSAPPPKLGTHLPPLPHSFTTTHRMDAPPHRPLSHIPNDAFDSGSKLPFELAKSKPLFGENGGRSLSSFDSPGEKPLFGDPSKSKPPSLGGVFDKDTNYDTEPKNGSPFAEGRLPFDIKNTYSGFGGNKKGEFDMDSSPRESDRFLPGSGFRPSSDFVHGLLADLDMMKQFYQTIKHEQSTLQHQMNRWNENMVNIKQQNGRDKHSLEPTPAVPFLVKDASKPFAFLQKNNEDICFVFANDAFCNLYGYNLGELVGRSWSILIPGEEQVGFSPLHKHAPSASVRVSPIVSLHESHKTKLGAVFKAVTRHQTFYDLDGKPSLDVVYIEEYESPMPPPIPSSSFQQHNTNNSTTTTSTQLSSNNNSNNPPNSGGSSSIPSFSSFSKPNLLPSPHSLSSHTLQLPLQQPSSHT